MLESVVLQDERVTELRIAIVRMVGQKKPDALIKQWAVQMGALFEPPLNADEVEEIYVDQMLRLIPAQRVADAPLVIDDDIPPIDIEQQRAGLEHDRDAEFERKDGEIKGPCKSNILDFHALAEKPAPPFRWFVPGWLSPHPTLLSGKGGMGKSLTALQMAVALAMGKRFIGSPVDPIKILLWSCEEDLDEIHRRLERICEFYEIGIEDLSETLTIDCRHGMDNTLLSSEYGRPVWTSLTEYLRQQVNDLKVDLWIGDNIAHMYACSENDRHPVTIFTSWLSGLRGEPWCPLLIGHVAKVGGSEYSGSTAWENAVRMRWYLGDKLPEEEQKSDHDDDPDETPGSLRFLCKRKTNYDQKDYVRFTMRDGLLEPEQMDPTASGDPGIYAALKAKKARDVLIRGLKKLTEMGENTTQMGGKQNLTARILYYKLAEGCSKKELNEAMRSLMVSGEIVRGENGRDAFRRKREGLILASEAVKSSSNDDSSMPPPSAKPTDPHSPEE